MNEKECLEAVIVEIGKRKRSRMQTPVTWETLGDCFESALNPKPEETVQVPYFRPPTIPPVWPKLKVKYDDKTGAALEWIVVNNAGEEAPYHGWSNGNMPEELDRLKATNIPERPAEEWQRRKQGGKQ
jgi:hypothetical protein